MLLHQFAQKLLKMRWAAVPKRFLWGRSRLWKFSTRTIEEQEKEDIVMTEENTYDDDDLTTIEGEDEVDEAIIDDLEEEEGEARLMIYHSGSSTAVSLEALLLGHEEPVTSLVWRKRKNIKDKPCLLSSSMDFKKISAGKVSYVPNSSKLPSALPQGIVRDNPMIQCSSSRDYIG